MKRYETIFITDSDLQDEERNSLTEKLNELISKQEGTLLKIDNWGQKRLAYEIKKKQRGHYIRLDYCGTGPLVDEMERLFRIDDKILKYMTVLLEETVDVEAVKEEIAKEEAEKERALKEKAENEQALKENAEANQKTSSASTDNAESAQAKAEETSSEEESSADLSTSDEPEAAPESEKTSVTEQDSSEKEQ
jgi:small subunit ribosomal protein S6